MANNDTMKGIGNDSKQGVTATTKNGDVLSEVPDIVWTKEERAIIRAIALDLSTSRKPVSNLDVVKGIKLALAAKAKAAFYAPHESKFNNWLSVEENSGNVVKDTKLAKAKYMHRYVPASAWTHLSNAGVKLDVLPPTVENPADSPATMAAAAATTQDSK